MKHLDHRDFAANLALLRIEKGVTQAELSRRSGLTHAAISLFEGGHRYPRLDSLIKLANGLNIRVSKLLGET